MPLNREHGEKIEGFEHEPYVLIPYQRLAELSNLLVPYEVKGKFRARTLKRTLFADVMAIAQQRFLEAGALYPVVLDETGVLAQAYPRLNKIAVIVMRPVAGIERFVTRVYDNIPRVVIDKLTEKVKA